MTTTAEAPVTPLIGPRYYRSFASYEIPFRPDEQIEFADTVGMPSYYVAYHNQLGQLVRFEKVRLLRAKEPREFAFRGAEPAGALVYFNVDRGSAQEIGLGPRITYREGEPLDEFWACKVAASGETCQAVLYRKEIAFSDTYDYWTTGQLRRRVMTSPSQPPTVAHFDLEGSPVADGLFDPNEPACAWPTPSS